MPNAMTEEEKTLMIERYLKGESPDPERQEVERLAEKDARFAGDIALMREVLGALGDRDLVRFQRDITAAWDAEQDDDDDRNNDDSGPDQAPRTVGSRRFLILLAVLLLAGVLGTWQYNRSNPPAPAAEEIPPVVPTPNSPPQVAPTEPVNPAPAQETKPGNSQPAPRPIAMAREYYGAVPEFTQLRKGGEAAPENSLTALQQAERAFAARQYQKAVRLLARPAPDVMEIAVYLRGHANFMAGDYLAAASDFQAVADREGLDLDNAQWYLALSNLALYGTQNKTVRDQLNNIAGDPEHTHHDKAIKLQEALNR